MHRLLRRQLRKHLGFEGEVAAALQPFVAAVDAAYADFDSDRAMLERSLELSVKELLEARDKATQAQARLTDAIESISEGFSLYDADDKLLIYNRRYLDMHGSRSIEVVKEGVSFETILRNAVASGEIRDAEGRGDAWVAERLARHRDPKGTHLQRRSDGRWIQINERHHRREAGGASDSGERAAAACHCRGRTDGGGDRHL
jgi:PAS domain-containing protein